jgi:hypothetical protein
MTILAHQAFHNTFQEATMKSLLFAVTLLASQHNVAMADIQVKRCSMRIKHKATIDNRSAEISVISDSEKMNYVSIKKEQLSALAVDVIDLKNQSLRSSSSVSQEARQRVEKIRNEVSDLNWGLHAFESVPALKWDEMTFRFDQSFNKVKRNLKDDKIWMNRHLNSQVNNL